MKKFILGMLALVSVSSTVAQAEQYSFTAYVPAGVSATLLNYFPSPMVSNGVSVEVRGCNATISNVLTMTGGIGLAQLDYSNSSGPVSEWATRSGQRRTFLGIQMYVTNDFPAYCTYVIRPL